MEGGVYRFVDFAFMKKVFKSISVNHNYICKYNIGSFASNLKYAEDARDLQDNWMSLFDVNLVSINEQFNPLISMDMVWANNLTTLGYQPSPGCEPEPGKRSVVGNLWQRDRFGTGIPVWKSSYLPKK